MSFVSSRGTLGGTDWTRAQDHLEVRENPRLQLTAKVHVQVTPPAFEPYPTDVERGVPPSGDTDSVRSFDVCREIPSAGLYGSNYHDLGTHDRCRNIGGDGS